MMKLHEHKHNTTGGHAMQPHNLHLYFFSPTAAQRPSPALRRAARRAGRLHRHHRTRRGKNLHCRRPSAAVLPGLRRARARARALRACAPCTERIPRSRSWPCSATAPWTMRCWKCATRSPRWAFAWSRRRRSSRRTRSTPTSPSGVRTHPTAQRLRVLCAARVQARRGRACRDHRARKQALL